MCHIIRYTISSRAFRRSIRRNRHLLKEEVHIAQTCSWVLQINKNEGVEPHCIENQVCWCWYNSYYVTTGGFGQVFWWFHRHGGVSRDQYLRDNMPPTDVSRPRPHLVVACVLSGYPLLTSSFNILPTFLVCFFDVIASGLDRRWWKHKLSRY